MTVAAHGTDNTFLSKMVMKMTKDEQRLASVLKSGARQAPDNKWFTRRVLNKLPVQNVNFATIGNLCYAIALIAALACWVLFLRDLDVRVITVCDILHFAVLFVLSLSGLLSVIRQIDKEWF